MQEIFKPFQYEIKLISLEMQLLIKKIYSIHVKKD